MSEQRGSPDDQFINLDDGDELRHWSRVLQTTPDEIKAAVCAVGTSALKVRAHLKLPTPRVNVPRSPPTNAQSMLSSRRRL